MTEYIAYHNGDWMPISELKIDPQDRGAALGDQVVEVERTFDGKGFRIIQHIERLYRSLKYVRIDPGLSAEEMLEVTEEGIRRNEGLRVEGGDLSITQLVTRGPGGPRAWSAGPPNVYLKIGPVAFEMFSPILR